MEQEMRQRTLWAAGLAVMLGAGLLAGCGGSSSSTASGGSKTITVEYWTNFDTPGTNATLKLINAAAKQLEAAHPGVKVVTDPITSDSESEYYTKLDLAESSSSTAPDVVMEDSFLIGADASAGYIQPLPELTSWSGWSAFPQAMQQISTYNGKVYGAMNSTDVQVIYYDKAAFKKAGIAVPWQPHSWADILAAAKAIKAHDGGVIPAWLYTGTPLGEASSFRGFEVFLNGTNDRIYDDSAKKWEAGGPGFNATWSFLQAMRPYEEPESDWSNPNASETANLTLMPQQKLGMIIDGSWVSTSFIPGGPKPWPGFFSAYGEAKLPTQTGSGAGYVDESGGFAWSVPAKAGNRSLALDMVETLSSAANIAQFDATDGNLPPRTDATSQPAWAKINKEDPVLTFASSLLQYTTYRPNLPDYTQISTEIAALTGDVSSGSMTAAQAEAAYKAKVTQIVGAANAEEPSS
jgi:multiple sugar transport system substrate-binding protein